MKKMKNIFLLLSLICSSTTFAGFDKKPIAVSKGGTASATSTGSGSVVLATSPVLTTPNLGTPSTLVATNATGTAAGLSIGGNAANITGVAAVANGGTGLSTQTAHAIYAGNATASPTPILPGSTGNVMTSNGTDWTSAAPGAALSTSEAQSLFNQSIAASNSGGALTVKLTQSDGSSNPASGSGTVSIGFRSGTGNSGLWNLRSITAAMSIVTPTSGATLGLVSGSVAQFIYVYALDVAGTIELAIAGSSSFDEGQTQTTTAIGGSSTSSVVLYSTSGNTGVIRLIGRVQVQNATAGVYSSIIQVTSRLQNANYSQTIISVGGAPTIGSGASIKTYSYGTTNVNLGGNDIVYTRDTVNGDKMTVQSAGWYAIAFRGGGGSNITGITVNQSSLTTSIQSMSYANGYRGAGSSAGGDGMSRQLYLNQGDIVRVCSDAGGTVGGNTSGYFEVAKISN